ncbi:MAG: hypothetical protein ABSB11_07470 [Sedimentisphaerales bacterium]|jgi:hypothetical protein
MDPRKIEYATGEEHFRQSGSVISLKLLDFWAWAYSDYFSNTARGVLAEFIVARALEIDLHEPRKAWAKFDLTGWGQPN